MHETKGFCRNAPQKVHPNFAQNLGRQILGNTFSALNWSGLNYFLEFSDFFSELLGASGSEVPDSSRETFETFRGFGALGSAEGG